MPQIICTKTDRLWLEQHFGRVIKNDPVLAIFKGGRRRILRDRMVQMAIADKEGRKVPPFPPVGFDVKLSRLRQSTLAQLGPEKAPDESADLPLNEQFQIERAAED